ncbi:hypothetical protein ONZ45_g7092 [Pleurotus djamor]|nr:hypothetical protein ONZ45_g7092 [Pleurotus djamor]
MYFPFITKRDPRGGGGGGRGGGGGGGRSGGGARGGGGGGGRGSAGRTARVSSSAGSRGASSRGSGGGAPVRIPAGQPFAGRQAGGGTRSSVYGTQTYGSGYPGVAGRGVADRGFPFFFWPLAWGGAAGVGTGAYLHSREYGNPDNSSRPGGPMVVAAFSPRDNTTQIFHLVADNSTVVSLIEDIRSNCSSILSSNSSTVPVAYNSSGRPQPEQTIQYYRASSVALTFDGYNNTGALAEEGTPDTPLPSYINSTLMNCLNTTIGDNVLLMDSSARRLASPSLGIFGLLYVIWTLSYHL